MDLMDVTILNVVLPTIQNDLGASPAEMQWALSGYTLALTVGLVAGARAGDRWGHRRVFVLGVAGFAAASALCSVAPSADLLVLARVVQGLFAAAMIPQVLSQIQTMYPARERGPAMAAFSALSGIAATLGPVLGPLLVNWNLADQGWRLVFWVNVPVGVLAAVVGMRLLPRAAINTAVRLPWAAVLIAALGLAAVLYPLIAWSGDAAATGGGRLGNLLLLVAGVLVLGGLCRHQLRAARRGAPVLLDLRLLRRRSVAAGLAVQFLFLIPIMGFFLTVMQFLQRGLGMSPLHAGLTMLPWSIAVTVVAAFAATVLLPRIGTRTVQLGLLVTAAGLLTLAVTASGADASTGTTALLPGIILGAVGMGLVVAPILALTLGDVAADEVGTGSGLFNTVSQLGASVGVAIIGTVFFDRLSTTDAAVAPVHRYGQTFGATLWISTALLGVALLASFGLPTRSSGQLPADNR